MPNLFSPIIDWVANRLGYAPIDLQTGLPPRSASSLQMRREAYRQRELFYGNSLYLPRQQGGLLEFILQYDLGRPANDIRKLTLLGYFNPAQQIVDTYASIFPGVWGKETKAADQVDGAPVNPKLMSEDPLGRLWRWSNLDTEKSKLLRWGANLGTVGLRVTGRDDPSPDKRRVFIDVDHPSRIVDFKEDDRGNVTDVMLRYKIADAARPMEDLSSLQIDVEETLSRESFSRTYNGVEQLEGDAKINKLGVCPYVILRHLDAGGPFGNWAYVGSEAIIHAINYQFALLTKGISKVMFAKWFATAGGDPPTQFDTGEDTISYVKSMPDTPPPSLQALIPKVDFSGILASIERLIKNLRERQPEMNFYNIDVTSNLSGEALQQFMKPTEKKILDARPNYDHALKRALQIGMSYMIGMDTLNLGTGTGSASAANIAYESGAMDFEFADRPALPMTTFQKLQQFQLEQAPVQSKLTTARQAQGIVSNAEQLRIMGKDEPSIKKIQNEKATQDAAGADATGNAL